MITELPRRRRRSLSVPRLVLLAAVALALFTIVAVMAADLARTVHLYWRS